MDKNKRRCFRCRGQKKMYRIAGAYSLINTGGSHVKCPLCNGEGLIDKIEVIETKLPKSSKKKKEKEKLAVSGE